ncbi:MAG: ArnT family glycosyltransferase [Streptosporangiaceae bacterium]
MKASVRVKPDYRRYTGQLRNPRQREVPVRADTVANRVVADRVAATHVVADRVLRAWRDLRNRLPDSWPLWGILSAQVVLTLPWLWSSAPFTDEALYIEAGHAEWAYWLHHAAAPYFASWFSGAPVIYPPLVAAADSAGGLAAARAVSLVAMLGTTALVYMIAKQLFRQPAGIFAALLFGVSGLVVHYGAFATYGPLSLFFLMLSAWAAVRIRGGSFGWLPACALALSLANATKYATLAWDPVIFGMILLHGWPKGAGRTVGRTASVAATVLVTDLGCLLLGGTQYANGLVVTTVFRSVHWASPSSAASILLRALAMTGLLLLPAAVGVVVSRADRWPLPVTLFLCLMVLAGLLGPIDQAHIHQLTSLDKNIGYGLPFIAIGAGFALSAGRRWLVKRKAWGRRAAAATVAVLAVSVLACGLLQKVQFAGSDKTQTNRLVQAIGQSYRPGTDIVSDGAGRVEQYYLPAIPAHSWIGIFQPDAELKQRITEEFSCGTVSVVVLRRSGRKYFHPYDLTVARLLKRAARYRLVAVIGKPTSVTDIWQVAPSAGGTGGCG